MLKALENLDEVDIRRAWGSIRENIQATPPDSLHYFEMKQHNPWCDEE
jgi:hypothetical protein